LKLKTGPLSENKLEKIREHITRLTGRLQDLIRRYADLQKKCQVQAAKIDKLEAEKAELLNRVRLMEEQQHVLKASAGKMNETDKAAFEKVLNGYIKQIDQCIQMLQHQ
jgi:chromosome segregation ATPase